MLGLLLLLVPLLEGQSAGWPGWTWGCFAASILALAAFLGWERHLARRNRSPAIDLALFGNRRFAAGAIVVLLIYSTSTSLFLCFALLTQSGLGLPPFEAGALFAPASAGFVVACRDRAKRLTASLPFRAGRSVASEGGVCQI
jgi:hypothetical protein